MSELSIQSKLLIEGLFTSPRLVQKAIETSVWWETAKQGPVLAKKYSSLVEGEAGHWFVRFGANDFLASDALRRIYNDVPKIKRAGSSGKIILRISDLRAIVASSVKNNETGTQYPRYPYDEDDGWFLRFGAMSLDAKAFILSACDDLKLKIIRIL